MAQDGSSFYTHRKHSSTYYPKEPIIFPYIRQYHSTPSLWNNPILIPIKIFNLTLLNTQWTPLSNRLTHGLPLKPFRSRILPHLNPNIKLLLKLLFHTHLFKQLLQPNHTYFFLLPIKIFFPPLL